VSTTGEKTRKRVASPKGKTKPSDTKDSKDALNLRETDASMDIHLNTTGKKKNTGPRQLARKEKRKNRKGSIGGNKSITDKCPFGRESHAERLKN